MSKVAFEQWHVAGLQAYKSASDQGIDGAKRAQESFTNPELKQLAGRVVETMTRHAATLATFLREADAEDSAHDEIMDGVNRGTDLMVKAAEGSDTLDIALLSGARVALNYFVVAFSNHAATATSLGMPQQAVTFQQMADEQQELFDAYTRLSTSVVYPEAVQS